MTPDALWAAACALYALPGAREELLNLQERCGADVPMLLWAAVLALENEALDVTTARAARAKAEGIAECVRAVRAVRRKLPDLAPAPASEPARAALLSGELALERLQLDRLCGHRGTKVAKVELLDNLNVALAACGCFANPESVDDLVRILSGA